MSPELLPEGLAAYVSDHTSAPPEHLRRLAEETVETLAAPQMLTGRVEGRLLEMLAFATGARRVLEIGTYSGYSALSLAAGLPDDARITTLEVSPEHADFARRHIAATPYADRIEIRVGPARDSLRELDGPWDLVFIDADKTGYLDYYEAVLPQLSDRGLIVVDNTLWSGAVADPAANDESTVALRVFNDRVRDDDRVVAVMLSVRDGVTLIRRVPS